MLFLADSALFDPTGLVSISPGTIIMTLCNLGVLMLLYKFFLHKPVTAMLEKRKDATNAEINAAAAAREKAETVEKEYLERLANSKEEAAALLADASRRAQTREDEIVADAKRQAEQIRSNAQEAVERERKKAINEIKNQISEMVILAAGSVAEKEISEADNRALIDSFLVKVGN